MFVVDTNVLLHAADDHFVGQQRARALFDQWATSAEPWFVTWSIVYEFLRVATHRRAFLHPLMFNEAYDFISELFVSPSFGVLTETDRHPQILRELSAEYPRAAGNLMHDLHIAALMREHGITEIRTADTDFHQFKFLRVVNPL